MAFLKDKVAVVTGATSGIGLSIAAALIKEGSKVYLIGRNPEKLNKVFANKILDNPNINFVKADLSRDEDITKMLNSINREDKIDILIHSAGVISLGSFEKHNVEHLDYQYKVNVRARYLITQRLLTKIKKAKGEIIFINSTAGLDSWENISQYTSSKHASRAFSDSLRKELSQEKVKVTSIFLASTATPMQEYIQKAQGQDYKPEKYMSPDEIAKVVISILTVSRNIAITEMVIKPN